MDLGGVVTRGWFQFLVVVGFATMFGFSVDRGWWASALLSAIYVYKWEMRE